MSSAGTGTPWACDGCLGRSWLVARLSGHLDAVRGRAIAALALSDDDLLAAVGGRHGGAVASERRELDLDRVRAGLDRDGVGVVCRCHPWYPARLHDLDAPPAALFVAGALEQALRWTASDADAVAVVGSRSASPYGLEVARRLASDLTSTGVTVISGMAVGIDTAAHTGALTREGRVDGEPSSSAGTIAVVAGYAGRAYPASARALHRRLRREGAVMSELGPDTAVRRWMLPARNRIIAALADLTVVVEAGAHSGALITAAMARALDRPVGAVPGRVTSPQAQGANALLAGGATVIRGAQDVLDTLYGSGARAPAPASGRSLAPASLQGLLAALADGHDTPNALAAVGLDAQQGLAALAELELGGHIRRGPGGRYVIVP